MRSDFTPREQECVDLLMAGCNQTKIAKELGICTRTVKHMLNHIYQKLGVPDADGMFCPYIRAVYILSWKAGLLTNWPDPL